MKNILMFVLGLTLSVGLISCSKRIDKDKLQFRNGLAYEVNSDKPFSGIARDYYPNSKALSSEEEFNGGKQDGKSLYYYSNGQLSGEKYFQSGNRTGSWKFWYGNGQKSDEEYFENDQRTGTWRVWDQSGQLEHEIQFNPKKLTATEKYYNSDGSVNKSIVVMNINSEGKEHNDLILTYSFFPIDTLIYLTGKSAKLLEDKMGKPLLTEKDGTFEVWRYVVSGYVGREDISDIRFRIEGDTVNSIIVKYKGRQIRDNRNNWSMLPVAGSSPFELVIKSFVYQLYKRGYSPYDLGNVGYCYNEHKPHLILIDKNMSYEDGESCLYMEVHGGSSNKLYAWINAGTFSLKRKR